MLEFKEMYFAKGTIYSKERVDKPNIEEKKQSYYKENEIITYLRFSELYAILNGIAQRYYEPSDKDD